MRTALFLSLSTLLWVNGCTHVQNNAAPYKIDALATTKAPWKVREIIDESGIDGNYRKFLGTTNKGYFVVQDFYKKSNKKYSDAFVITQEDFATDIRSTYSPGLFKNHAIDGMLIVWYENGQKAGEVAYQDRKIQSTFALWYENGQKKVVTQFRDGEMQGTSTEWYENGKKRLEGHFLNGKKQGSWIYWYDNGQKMAEGQFLNGVQHGHVIGWYENGQKMKEGQFLDGVKQGLWIEWDENGKKISETIYEADEKVSNKTLN